MSQLHACLDLAAWAVRGGLLQPAHLALQPQPTPATPTTALPAAVCSLLRLLQLPPEGPAPAGGGSSGGSGACFPAPLPPSLLSHDELVREVVSALLQLLRDVSDVGADVAQLMDGRVWSLGLGFGAQLLLVFFWGGGEEEVKKLLAGWVPYLGGLRGGMG